MENIILELINKILENFDFTFCVTVNIATYLTIKLYTDYKKKSRITTWNKRIIFLIISIIISIVYSVTGSDIKIIFNSFILAPVSWSWIFKPICDKFNIGYESKIKNNYDNKLL